MGYPFWDTKEEAIKDIKEYPIFKGKKYYVVKVKLAPNSGFLNAPESDGVCYTYSAGKNIREARNRIKKFPEFIYKKGNKIFLEYG
jgi:hypothetical protein